eukprot:6180802-Pleurochrysis_carterae.AAC.4
MARWPTSSLVFKRSRPSHVRMRPRQLFWRWKQADAFLQPIKRSLESTYTCAIKLATPLLSLNLMRSQRMLELHVTSKAFMQHFPPSLVQLLSSGLESSKQRRGQAQPAVVQVSATSSGAGQRMSRGSELVRKKRLRTQGKH